MISSKIRIPLFSSSFLSQSSQEMFPYQKLSCSRASPEGSERERPKSAGIWLEPIWNNPTLNKK